MTPLDQVPSIQDELKALKQDNGLLKLSNEQLAHNYKQADQCAHEREVQILALLREREAMAALLERIVSDGLLSQSDAAEVRACLSRLGRGK